MIVTGYISRQRRDSNVIGLRPCGQNFPGPYDARRSTGDEGSDADGGGPVLEPVEIAVRQVVAEVDEWTTS